MVGFVFAIRVRGPSEKVKRSLSLLDSSPDPTCLIFSQGKVWKTSSSLEFFFSRESSTGAVAEESRRKRALGERGERGEGGRT